MEIAVAQIGLLLQILGVLMVLFSQAVFAIRSRKYGGLEKAFYTFLSVVRIRGDPKKMTKKEIKEITPEWWALAEYLSDDIRTSSIGLVVTLIGLVLEFF